MSSAELDNLVATGQLKKEPRSQSEFDSLVKSGAARLADAKRKMLAYESRFDLAYNAAHALALAALRWQGYRSENRYIVFQVLEHTVGLDMPQIRVLAKAHTVRNSAEYEGHLEPDERLLENLIAAAEKIAEAVATLPKSDA